MRLQRREAKCIRCKFPKPAYAKGMCRACYGVALYYYRQGRPLPPYRDRTRTCQRCSASMRGRADWYCSVTCRQTSAQQRRIRQAARRLGPWRPWFGHLRMHERDVLDRRLAGETHHAIGRLHGWTRQYNQQLESILLRRLKLMAALFKGPH